MGLTNVEVMVPFVRTLPRRAGHRAARRQRTEARRRTACAHHDVRAAEQRAAGREFLEYFDGMSIGSNDLTQLTLGLDRDSALARGRDFDERDPAVKALLAMAIAACRARASTSASAARARPITPTWRAGWSIRASTACR
jgi:pyruvate,water dikinase